MAGPVNPQQPDPTLTQPPSAGTGQYDTGEDLPSPSSTPPWKAQGTQYDTGEDLPPPPPGWKPRPPPTPEDQPVTYSQALALGSEHGQHEYQSSVAALANRYATPKEPDPATWLNQPWERADGYHILERGIPKFLYGLADSHPEIAGGIASAAMGGEIGAGIGSVVFPGAGTAVGATLGAAIGGGIGFGMMSWLHQIGPNFYEEYKKTPKDFDGAFHRADAQAGIHGLASGASWAAFGGLNPFKTATANWLTQIFGIQPLIGVTGQVGSNVYAGRDWQQNLLPAYTQSAVSTAIPVVPHIAAKAVARGAAMAAPLADTLGERIAQNITDDSYNAVRDYGAVPNPQAVTEVKNNIKKSLINAGANPAMVKHNNIFKTLDLMDTPAGEGHPITMSNNILATRHQLSDMLHRQIENYPADAKFTRMALDRVDAMLDSSDIIGKHFGYGEDAGTVIPNLSAVGRTMSFLRHNLKQFREWQTAVDNRPQGTDELKKWQSQLRPIVEDEHEISRFGPDAQKVMQTIVNAGTANEVASLFDRFAKYVSGERTLGGTRMIANILLYHFLSGHLAGALTGIGLLRDALQTYKTRGLLDKAANLRGLITKEGFAPETGPSRPPIPGGQWQPPPASVRGVGPFMPLQSGLPMQGQQYQYRRGGAAERALRLARRG
jgi:hypothetical protein